MKAVTRIVMIGLLILLVSRPASAALVGYWEMSAADPAGTAKDYTTATPHNGTMNGTDYAIVTDGTRGDVLQINITGTDSYVAVSGLLSTTAITWAAWVKFNVAGSYPMVVSDGGSHELRLYGGSARPEWLYGSGDPISPTAISMGAWHLLAGTHDAANNLVLYVDGVNKGTGTSTGSFGVNVKFGERSPGAYPVRGWMDDVQMWNEALSAGKVAAIYNAVVGYTGLDMEKLFTVYNNASGTATTSDGRMWFYTTGLAGHNPGDWWAQGSGYNLQLDAAGKGVTSGVPEPATILLFSGAVIGLVRRKG